MTRGFLIVDKPGGLTSNAVVGKVKKATGIKKVGHAGTLDPMATGTLVVGVGKVTRLIRFIQDQPKEYLAQAQFGVSTDTLDADGAVLSREPMEFEVEDLEKLRPRFTGVIQQVPPMVSALKKDGRRLHELAREGKVVERESRPVEIHDLEFVSVSPGPYPVVEFRVVCGKGTYVRSLADDLAAALGGQAHLTALRRTRVGCLRAEDGVRLDDLEAWEDHLLSPARALEDLAQVKVTSQTAEAVSHGMRFVGGELIEIPEAVPVGVLDKTGELIAVYRRDGDQAVPEVVLPV